MSRASDLILRIERQLAKVDREYNQFLGGTSPVEPWQERDNLLKDLKTLRNLTKLRTEELFRADNLSARVQAYISRWERQTNKKMGTRRRREKKPVEEAATKKPTFKPGSAVRIKDAQRDRAAIVQLYDEYTRNNLILGVRNQLSFSKFSAFLQNQTEKIKANKRAQSISYTVVVKDQKVLIKSKANRES